MHFCSHQTGSDARWCSVLFAPPRLITGSYCLHRLEWGRVDVDATAVRRFGDGLKNLPLRGRGERRGGRGLLRRQGHGGLQAQSGNIMKVGGSLTARVMRLGCTLWFTWMGSLGSVEGRGSGECEVWYMGGGVGETMGTCKQKQDTFTCPL